MRAHSSTIATLLFLALALGAGAANAGTPTPPASPDWRAAVATTVADDPSLADLVPSDVSAFCPAYAQLDQPSRAAFWETFFVQLAQAESGGDPARTRWLAYDTVMHRPTFRRGLFQISTEAARSERYGCDATSSAALTSADGNTTCALRIFHSAVGASAAIADAGAYWPTLAHPSRLRQLERATAASAGCSPDGAG